MRKTCPFDLLSNLGSGGGAALDDRFGALPESMGIAIVARDCVIRAHGYASSTSNTLGRRVHGNIPIAFVHSFGGAGSDAGSLGAMIAERRDEFHPDVGKLTYGFRYFTSPS